MPKVGDLNLHWQAVAQALTGMHLRWRVGEAHGLHAMVLGGVAQETAPAAADVEQAHTGLQFQFAANLRHLGFLGFFE